MDSNDNAVSAAAAQPSMQRAPDYHLGRADSTIIADNSATSHQVLRHLPMRISTQVGGSYNGIY